jgi:hypothetical protein
MRHRRFASGASSTILWFGGACIAFVVGSVFVIAAPVGGHVVEPENEDVPIDVLGLGFDNAYVP